MLVWVCLPHIKHSKLDGQQSVGTGRCIIIRHRSYHQYQAARSLVNILIEVCRYHKHLVPCLLLQCHIVQSALLNALSCCLIIVIILYQLFGYECFSPEFYNSQFFIKKKSYSSLATIARQRHPDKNTGTYTLDSQIYSHTDKSF